MDWSYQEAKALSENPEFIAHCDGLGVSVSEQLRLSEFSRADKCSRPLAVDMVNVETGDTVTRPIACGSPNADVCPECAGFLQRLRNRQILDTLDNKGVRTALFTLTAPSFGKVHRAFWTIKDEFKYRKLSERQRLAKRLLKQKQSSPCVCGKWHDDQNPLVGTPVGDYDYLASIMWSRNLPRLVASAKRRIAYLAEQFGIIVRDTKGVKTEDNLRLYTVYERQKRGELHTHMLIVVENNEVAFSRLVRAIADGEVSPTARIPEADVAHYRSSLAKARLMDTDYVGHPAESIPEANWKGGKKLVPATRFGEVFDIRILEPDTKGDDNPLETMTYKQASSYVAKYLTKNQSAFAPDSTDKMSAPQKQHYKRFREVALLLLADYVLYQASIDTLSKEIMREFEEVQLRESTSLSDTDTEFINMYLNSIVRFYGKLKSDGVKYSYLIEEIINGMTDAHFGRVFMLESYDETHLEFLSTYNSSPFRVPISSVDSEIPKWLMSLLHRRLKIRLNKLASNGGFTGSLVSMRNWRRTLKDFKDEIRAWAKAKNPSDEVWEFLDFNWEEMFRLRSVRLQT